MHDDRGTSQLLGKIGQGMARIASLFAFAGSLVVLMLGVLDRPISLRNLLVGVVCWASLAAARDRRWGRMLAALGLFTGAFLAALHQHGSTGPVAIKEQWFAWLSFGLGAAVLGGHALHFFSGTRASPNDAPTPLPPNQNTVRAVSPRRRQ